MIRSLAPLLGVALCASAGALSSPAWADSTAAYCVLSHAHARTAPQQGPCRWSQRQGNVTIIFQSKEYVFASEDEGRTYTRMNRDGAEAGPVFTLKGHDTLSVYWRRPAADAPGF